MTPSSEEISSRRRFELKRRVGEGAFGEVYLAEQVGAGGFRRPVALKILNETASKMKEAARRMRDEARILGRLQHRHLVDVLDLVQLGDRWAVVMAYVPGADLEQVLMWAEQEEARIPGAAIAEIGVAVARALAAAWSAEDSNGKPLNVVHRDIKPSNVRVTPDGEVKVLDFGVARVHMVGREAETRRQGMIGTERYMAPERILLEGDGPEGDVYALGATLAELVTGEPIGRTPVRDEAHREFVAGVVSNVRARIEGPEEAADAFAALIGRTLDADPSARPSATDLALALDDLSRRLPGPSLARWSTEVIARVPESVGTGSGEPVTGTLIEGSDLTPGGRGARAAGAPASGEPPAPGGGQPSASGASSDDGSPRRSMVLAPLLVVSAALFTVAFLLVWAAQEPGGESGSQDAAGTPSTVSSLPAQASPETPPETPPPGEEPSGAPEPQGQAASDLSSPETVVSEDEPEDAPARRDVRRAEPKAEVPSLGGATPAAQEASAAPARSSSDRPGGAGSADAPPEPIAAGPRVSRAMVLVEDVDGFDVVCGDRQVSGTASARITDFPAGVCTVTARLGAQTFRGRASLDAPGTLRCTLDEDGLSCR